MWLRTGNVASSTRISGLLFVTWMTFFPVGRADNLALLSGTLRTYQKAACDEEMVTLKCPRGTSITIQVAQYGKSAPTNDICASELEQYNPVAVEIVGNSSCLWPNALQYSLLQTVVEACQKKGQCKFHTSPKAFGGDPCPGVRKFVEVAYKCRPYEFRSKVGCENDVMHLSCNPHSRIAVYSASYGRTEYESIQCPQPQGVPEETCLVSYATETVMQICHGKRRCALSADKTTFGSPCRRNSRMYLKVVYTCVPRKVLKERYEEPAEEDEVPLKEGHSMESDDFYDTDPGEDHWYGREPAAIPPAPKVAADPPPSNVTWQPRAPGPSGDDSWTVTKSPHAGVTNTTQEGSIDSVYIYIIISVAASLLLCAGLGLTHCIIRKHYSKRDTKAPDISATTEIPNGFNDSISEVDTDIDMSTIGAPVAAVNAGLKPERIAQFSDMSLGAKGSLYIGRQVPNTYPHHPTANMYGANEEFGGAVPVRAIEAGTLRRGVQIQMPPQLQTDVVVSPRSLNRYSNAQYYYG